MLPLKTKYLQGVASYPPQNWVNTFSESCSEVLTFICPQFSPLRNVDYRYFTVSTLDFIQVQFIWRKHCLLSMQIQKLPSSKELNMNLPLWQLFFVTLFWLTANSSHGRRKNKASWQLQGINSAYNNIFSKGRLEGRVWQQWSCSTYSDILWPSLAWILPL